MAAEVLFDSEILYLRMVSEVSHIITCKGNNEKKYIDGSDRIYCRTADIGENFEEYQADEQDRCANFSFG